MAEILNIELSKTQLDDGTWLLYYNGTDLDLDCGTYYIKIDIDGTDWYSELFTVKSVSSGVHPGLIADNFHLPIRFYDSKLKQNYYKCNNLCDLGIINPIDHILPFLVDITGLGAISTIETKIICYDGSNEYDLTGDLEYLIDNANKLIYQNGNTLSGQLLCGVYYLKVTINGINIFYSEHFEVKNITNIIVSNLYLYTESNTPTGFEQIETENEQYIIL